MKFKEVLDKSSEFVKLKESLEKTPVSVAGIVESCLAHFIVSVKKDTPALVIMNSDEEAKSLFSDLKFFTDDVLYFPTREYVYYNVSASAHFKEHFRISVLDKLLSKNKDTILVTSIEACTGFTIPPDYLLEKRVEIKTGECYDIDALLKRFVELGYTRCDVVEGPGQFSSRGGIVDIYSPYSDFPFRIEFFDDEVDSVRCFDYLSQRTVSKTEEAVILACRETVLDENSKERLIDYLDESIKKLSRKRKNVDNLIKLVTEDKEAVTENRELGSIDKYQHIINNGKITVMDYFSNDDMIFVFEPKRLSESAKSVYWRRDEEIKNLCEEELLYCEGLEFYSDFAEFKEKSGRMCHISVNSLNHSSILYNYKQIYDFKSRQTVSLHGKIDYLFDDLREWQKEEKTVIILASNRLRGENISGILNDRGIKNSFKNDVKEFKKGEISVITGELKKGFEYTDLDFILISEKEIFETEKKKQKRKIENTKRLKSYSDINIGDYVVHQAHGIGRYIGMNKMTVAGITKDYLKIQYAGTDSLYIPVEQLDMLYKYVGNTEKELKLNKLNGNEWNRTKAKVRSSTKDIAQQLIKLYAERQNAKGHAFSADGPWQRDFEDTFLFDETDDQLRCIEEVKNDMENTKPMDRLLCGDVGYGKTEVAIRAAFKAAVDSKQVAYLCPTTVLAMQHYDTFKKRMEDFAIKTEMLSRFRTPKQQKEILKNLKNGSIDVIIGTHKLLQKDVEFKDLGLLIIDEEQRFGVAHKERLKELKKNIDVLSMTATPIPRTLHMSMINIRDMSVLETPPDNRHPVQTYVLEYNEPILIDAMKRELQRGGQVFYLHNRVNTIYYTANRIKELIPDANVSVGHGKMSEEELEDIMYDMVNGKTDILVCTTIIETGLDIPNANTMIIENADKMGLSQLYQLRGRVGRSNRSAYAYFTYHQDKILSEVAQKRLRAIKEFTEFGSGFKIAMRDLEIRGAGNLLGAQQHGHMDAVGYDMYCKLLKESVDEAQGIVVVPEITTSVDFDVDAYIPEKYIENHNVRIDIYKKIAAISSEEDITEIIDELIDRFSDPPVSVINLVNIAYIKYLANSAGIVDLSVKNTKVTMKFDQTAITPEICVELIKEFPHNISVSTSKIPTVIYSQKERKNVFENIKFLLHTIIRLKNEQK